MTANGGASAPGADSGSPAEARRDLPPAARRALDEAAERRARPPTPLAPESNGRGGPDPVRYGDWEVKGLASDF
jgi:hypothetical protein